MEITKGDIICSLCRALLGEIESSVRMIVYKYDREKRSFTLRFYYDRQIQDDDLETVNVVLAEFISDYKFDTFDELIPECIYSLEKKGNLDTFDGIIFSRKE